MSQLRPRTTRVCFLLMCAKGPDEQKRKYNQRTLYSPCSALIKHKQTNPFPVELPTRYSPTNKGALLKCVEARATSNSAAHQGVVPVALITTRNQVPCVSG